ncbi:hypothetical protein MRX96_016185 [Rhipicephalus microplus]
MGPALQTPHTAPSGPTPETPPSGPTPESPGTETSDGGAPAALLADGRPLVRRHDQHPVLRSCSPLVEAVVGLAYEEAVLTPPEDCAASCIGIFWVKWLFAFEDGFRAVAFSADPSVSMSANSGSCLAPVSS